MGSSHCFEVAVEGINLPNQLVYQLGQLSVVHHQDIFFLLVSGFDLTLRVYPLLVLLLLLLVLLLVSLFFVPNPIFAEIPMVFNVFAVGDGLPL